MEKIDTKTIIDFIFFILALIVIFLLCNSNELILLLFLIYLIYGETIAFFQKKIIDEYIDTEIKKRNFERNQSGTFSHLFLGGGSPLFISLEIN